MILKKRSLYSFLLLLLIVFFSYTFINKVLDIDSFMLNIAKTGLFRGWMVDAVAYLALVLEGTCIALLLFRESIGLIASWLMMLCFTCYICILYFFSLYEICGCGGILNGLPFWWHLLINSAIIVVISYLIYKKFYGKI